MSQQVRYVLFILLSVVIIFAWQAFFAPKPAPKPPTSSAPSAQAGKPSEGGAPSAPATVGQAPEGSQVEPEQAEQPQDITVETNRWKATFTSSGAALRTFELAGRKQLSRPKDGQRHPVDLAHPGEGQPLPLSTEIGSPDQGFGPGAAYRLVRQGEGELVFARTRGPLTVEKRYSWKPDSYLLSLEITARKEGGAGPVPVRVLYTGYEVPQPSRGFFSFGSHPEVHQAVCHIAGERSMRTKVYAEGKGPEVVAGLPSFTGIDEKYFLAALAPTDSVQGPTCELSAPQPGQMQAALQATLPAQGAASAGRFDLYLGPKDDAELTAAGHELHAAIDYGFFAVICRVLLVVLRLFERLIGNWGLAIIALTVLMKAITFPLTHRQMKSMEEMRRLAPKLEAIKQEFAGDQQRINLETMKMYREHNVQPLGGCMPMLIQMPVWFALYATLGTAFELYNEPFIGGWINDLTSRDPYYITPVLMTVTMVLSQLLTPQTAQTQQMKFMTYGMPLMFGVIMLSLPAGLVLYIFTNNLLSIAQSLWFRRKFGGPTTTPPPAVAKAG